jgi:predicted nucleotidyltransferase
MTQKERILKKIISVINATAPDSEVYLYGSRARGDYKETSDWDLLILLNLNTVSFNYETKIMDDFYDIELETGEIFSPLIYSKNEWLNKYSILPLFENIEKEGIKLK